MKSVVFTKNEFTAYNFTNPYAHGEYSSIENTLEQHKPNKVFIVKDLTKMYEANMIENPKAMKKWAILSELLSGGNFSL